jgi:acetyl esterase/lipase
MDFVKLPAGLSALLLLVLPFSAAAQTNAPPFNPPPAYPPPPPGVAALHDVVIGKGGGRDLHAEVAYPANAPGPFPAVIYIHGGGWIGGDYRQAPIALLAKSGYFAATIEYRLSREAKWPAQIEDCKLAVRWLRANAAKYHVNPNRIGVWGASAGGHLVACLGTMADEKKYEGDGGYPGVSSAVQAVVDFFGPTDFTNLTPQVYTPAAIKFTEEMFGVTHDQDPDLWKSGSPLYYVKAGDPPMLLVHGDSDGLVPLAQSTEFDAALTKAGVPHQFVIVKNADHGFRPKVGMLIQPSPREITKIVFDFLAKYLKGP